MVTRPSDNRNARMRQILVALVVSACAHPAETGCRDAVLRRLRAPATAEFPSPSEMERRFDEWIVHGEVDAQNGFGAMIRQRYECAVERRSGRRWAIKGVTLTER